MTLESSTSPSDLSIHAQTSPSSHYVVKITTKPLRPSETKRDKSSRASSSSVSEGCLWLQDYLDNGEVYAIDFTRQSMKYYLHHSSELSREERKAKIVLNRLKSALPGMDGEVIREIIPPFRSTIQIWHLKAPNHFFPFRPIPIIQEFIALAMTIPVELHCTLLYQQTGVERTPYEPYFTATTYFWCDLDPYAENEQYLPAIGEILDSLRYSMNSCLKIDSTGRETRTATFSPIPFSPEHCWKLLHQPDASILLYCNLRISPKNFDSRFPSQLKILQSVSYGAENISLEKHGDTEDQIHLGHFVFDSQITSLPATLPINDLARHMGIYGKPGFGKSKLLRIILDQLALKRPTVGKLILGIGKSSQSAEYRGIVDQYFTYGDEMLLIPYIALGHEQQEFGFSPQQNPTFNFEQNAGRSGDYQAAGVGVGNPYNYMFHKHFKSFQQTHRVPKNLRSFFKVVIEDHINAEHPYGVNVQKNILRVLENRIESLLTPEFNRVTAYQPALPSWLNYWIQGKSVFLDLSPCTDSIKRYLVFLILNLIQTFLPEQEEGLKYVLVIDECHRIFSKPDSLGFQDSDDNNAARKMSQIIHEILAEYRSRGLSVIFADQDPPSLIEAIPKLPGIRVLFNLSDHQSPRLFTSDPQEIRILQTLPKRNFLLMNAEERFIAYSKNTAPHIVSVHGSIPTLSTDTEWIWHFQKIIYQSDFCHDSCLQEPIVKRISESQTYLLDHKQYLQAIRVSTCMWGKMLFVTLEKFFPQTQGKKLTLLQLLDFSRRVLQARDILISTYLDLYVPFKQLWEQIFTQHIELSLKNAKQFISLAGKLGNLIMPLLNSLTT